MVYSKKKQLQMKKSIFFAFIISLGRQLEMPFLEYAYNWMYFWENLRRTQQSDNIIIFGEHFDSKQAKERMKKLVYLTYRNDIELNGVEYISDQGWGCMLRVVSMLVAQVIQRYQGPTFFDSSQVINEYFIHKNGAYSIQKMLQRSWSLFHKKEKEWFSTVEVSKIIASLINDDKTTCLRVFVCDGNISKETCLDFLMTEKHQLQSEFSSVDLQICKNLSHFQFTSQTKIHPGLIIINLKEGLNLTGQEGQAKIASIKRSMTLKSFAGILGGRGERGLYIVGYSQTNFIYLDPHQVTNQSIFHTDSLLSMAFREATHDMALCFYISSYQEFEELMKVIDCYLYKNLPQESGTAQQINGFSLQLSIGKVKVSGISEESTIEFQLLDLQQQVTEA